MRAVARWLSIVLTVGAALLAALVVLPPLHKQLAFLALFVDEKTFALVGAALVGLGLARLSGPRAWIVVQKVLTVAIVIVAAIPPAQAFRLAVQRHVAFDFPRYLTAPIDTAPAHPSQTLTFATVDGRPLALDVYRPSKSGRVPAIVPAILVVHGGGWSSDDKGGAPLASAWLAAQGYAVFDVQYRLAPPPTWQTAVGDVKCAIGWVKRRARDAGVDVDPARVTLLGRSAGGQLVLLAAYAPDDPALPPSCPAGDTHVASVISFYGPTDLTWAWDHPPDPRVFDVPKRVGDYMGGTPTTEPARFRLVSPAERVTAAAPPTLLIHGGRDAFVKVEQAERLEPKLTALGVRHDLLVIPYAQHGFDFISGGLGGQLAEQTILRFLRADR